MAGDDCRNAGCCWYRTAGAAPIISSLHFRDSLTGAAEQPVHVSWGKHGSASPTTILRAEKQINSSAWAEDIYFHISGSRKGLFILTLIYVVTQWALLSSWPVSRGHKIVCARVHTETRSVCQSVRACVCVTERVILWTCSLKPHTGTHFINPWLSNLCRLKQFINRGRQRWRKVRIRRQVVS